jgi:hypothetical protein
VLPPQHPPISAVSSLQIAIDAAAVEVKVTVSTVITVPSLGIVVGWNEVLIVLGTAVFACADTGIEERVIQVTTIARLTRTIKVASSNEYAWRFIEFSFAYQVHVAPYFTTPALYHLFTPLYLALLPLLLLRRPLQLLE